MDVKSLKTQVLAAVEGLMPGLAELADLIHQNPETAYNEVKASGWLAEYLNAQGFAVERAAGGLPTAFKSEVKGQGGPGPSVALISEYDALPGLGHACGHNIIATMGVGAAAALAQFAGDLPGRILSIGTPAEEGGGGKVKLIDAGIFDDVDAAMMIHPFQRNVTYRISLSRLRLFMDFHGKPSHASGAPEKGINALDALVAAYQNVALLRQQLPPTTRIHAIITNGGSAPNIIPELASAYFYLRTPDKEFLPELLRRVKACAEGAAQAHGARVEFRQDPFIYEPMRYNPEMTSLFEANLRTLGVESEPADLHDSRDAGSTDMGNVSWKVPSIHPYVKMVPLEVSTHTHEFAEAAGSRPGKDLIRLGAAAMAMTAIDLLTSPGRMEAVRRSFEEGS